MLKIVKGYGYGGYGYVPAYSVGEPVKIDNTVYMPGEDEETGEVISAEELRRRAEEEKAEQERRINEEIETRYAQMLAERSAALEQERAKILEDGRSEAAAISAKAKADTMAIMEKAKRECAILKEQAKKEGYDEGFADGRKESLEKYEKYIDASGRLLSEINSRKEAYYVSAEEEMRQTVFELVNRIVRTELKINPQVVDGLIADAAKNFRNSDYVKITLAEDGITERFRTDEKLIKEIIPFIPEVEIELDEDAEEGTIIVDNGSEIVDAGVPTQLEFLKEILRTTRGEDSGEAFEIASDSVLGGSLEESAEKGDAEAAMEFVPEMTAEPVAEAAPEPEPEPVPEPAPEPIPEPVSEAQSETAEASEPQEVQTVEPAAESEPISEEETEEASAQVNFADIMADVIAENKSGETETAEEALQAAEAVEEAVPEAAEAVISEDAAVNLMADLEAEAAELKAAETDEPPKTAKTGRKSKPRKSAAENAE